MNGPSREMKEGSGASFGCFAFNREIHGAPYHVEGLIPRVTVRRRPGTFIACLQSNLVATRSLPRHKDRYGYTNHVMRAMSQGLLNE